MALSLLDQFGGSQAAAQQKAKQAQQQADTLANSPFKPYKPNGGGLVYDREGWNKYNAYQDSVRQSQNAADNAQQNVMAQDPGRNPAAAFQRILGTSEDFYNQASGSNAMDQMLQQELMKRAQGGGPYDQTTINALKTGANEQAAAAEATNNQAAMQSLEARGFKPGDPAYQAALARNREQRQKSNQGTSLDIAQRANVANYNAQGQALGQAAGYNAEQQGRQQAALENLQRQYNKVGWGDFRKDGAYNVPSYLDLQRKG